MDTIYVIMDGKHVVDCCSSLESAINQACKRYSYWNSDNFIIYKCKPVGEVTTPNQRPRFYPYNV